MSARRQARRSTRHECRFTSYAPMVEVPSSRRDGFGTGCACRSVEKRVACGSDGGMDAGIDPRESTRDRARARRVGRRIQVGERQSRSARQRGSPSRAPASPRVRLEADDVPQGRRGTRGNGRRPLRRLTSAETLATPEPVLSAGTPRFDGDAVALSIDLESGPMHLRVPSQLAAVGLGSTGFSMCVSIRSNSCRR